jgi:hypothetical protein
LVLFGGSGCVMAYPKFDFDNSSASCCSGSNLRIGGDSPGTRISPEPAK